MTLPRRFRAAVIALAASMALPLAAPALAAPAGAQTATPPANCLGPRTGTWININVEGVRNGNGLMAISLYPDDSSQFLVKHGSLYTSRFDAVAGTTRACVFVPRAGVYALAVYHDEDSSRKLNRSGLGMPAEGFGFSNNPSTFAGIPAFRSVRLNVARTNLSTRIRLRYP